MVFSFKANKELSSKLLQSACLTKVIQQLQAHAYQITYQVIFGLCFTIVQY